MRAEVGLFLESPDCPFAQLVAGRRLLYFSRPSSTAAAECDDDRRVVIMEAATA